MSGLSILPTVQIKDEGVAKGRVSILDFVGAGVAATVSGGTATITISGGAGGASLDTITAAAADQAGIANGDWNIRWNWAKTTNSEVAFEFGESAASTNGTSTSGVPNQVLLKLSTLAASTMSPLSVYVRGNHVFSVSPTVRQILAFSGTSTNPVYGFAADVNSGMYWTGTQVAFSVGSNNAFQFDISRVFQFLGTSGTAQIQTRDGTAAVPYYSFINSTSTGMFSPGVGIVGMTAGGAEIVRWQKATTGGGWQIMDEADSDPTTTELDSLDSFAVYMKNNKIVFSYNNAGTITYISIPCDGSTTTWTHSTTAP